MLAGLDAFNSTFLADLDATQARISAANRQITSGFRVNQASDDPGAVPAIIDYQSRIDQATQVQTNLNNASATASIADGALAGAATLLDRLNTIGTLGGTATTTATTRTQLGQEVQAALQQLVALSNTTVRGQYIFGGDDPATAPYTFNWNVPGGVVQNNTSANTVTIQNAFGASITAQQTAQQIFGASGTGLTGNSQRVDLPGATFVKGTAGANDETFHFSVYANGQTSAVTATVAASAGGQTLTSVLRSLNSQLSAYGISASAGNHGLLQFSGSSAFTVNESSASTGAQLLTSNSGAGAAVNASNYSIAGQSAYSPASGDTLVFQASAGPATVVLAPGTSLTAAITQINAATAGLGVYAVQNASHTGISFQAQNSFSVTSASAGTFAAAGANAAAAPTSSSIFQNVYALGQALLNNDQTGIQNATAALPNSVTQLGQSTTFNGTVESWLQDSTNSAAALMVDFQAALTPLRATNVAQQATALTLDQTALQAALAAHGALQTKSLFSYLG